jgi:hypothetical protein
MKISKYNVLPNLVWVLILVTTVIVPVSVLAETSIPGVDTELTGTWMGILALVILFAAYALIISEQLMSPKNP